MKMLLTLFLSLCVLVSVPGCSRQEVPPIDLTLIEQAQISNLHTPREVVFSSAQPTQEQLEILSRAGIKHIINLRPLSEQDWNEAEHVASLGMQYHAIAVPGLAGVTSENAKALDQLLTSIKGEPVLVHCSSGNRVGALVALAQGDIYKRDTDAAIAEGKRWGLSRLEPAVRSLLDSR